MKYFWLIMIILNIQIPVQAALLRVPSDYGSIHEAVDAATHGDTILVAPGIYSGNLNTNIRFFGKSILLSSETGPQDTSIDCEGSARGFIFDSGESTDTQVEGFRVLNGSAGTGSGGGATMSLASPTLTNCVFEGCTAARGGGVFASGSNGILQDCQIIDCQAGNGGGLYCQQNSSVTVYACTFRGNSSEIGGAMYATTGTIDLDDSVLDHNTAEYSGGCLYLLDTRFDFQNSYFTENSAGIDGGAAAIYSAPANTWIRDCRFYRNHAGNGGGALFMELSIIQVISSEFWENSAVFWGGAVYARYSSSSRIGGDPGYGNDFSGNMAAVGSDLATLYGSPTLSAPNNRFSGYHLSDYYVSPQETWDLTGSTSDLNPITSQVYVSPTGSDSNPGTSPNTPFRTITHAVSRIFGTAQNPVTVTLMAGTFSPGVNGERMPVPLLDHVTLRGAGQSVTVLDGEGETGPCIMGYKETNINIEQMSITGAVQTHGNGSGLWLDLISGTVLDCSVYGNSGELGAGIHIRGELTDTLVGNCTVSSNIASLAGGGIYSGGYAQINNCVITGNTSAGRGGGIELTGGSQMTNCLVAENTATGQGGGISCFNYMSNPLQDRQPGGSPGSRTPRWILNSTMANNTCLGYGGGVAVDFRSEAWIMNSILWNNSADLDANLYIGRLNDESELHIAYSCVENGESAVLIQGGTLDWGESMIQDPPLFTSGPRGDYYLSQQASGQVQNSSCLDSGNISSDEICFALPYGSVCLDEFTTRTDEIHDAGKVDIGYHPVPSDYATPSPIPSATPTPMTATATPSPTPQCIRLGVTISMPSSFFVPGDTCACGVLVCNPTGTTLENVPLFVILDVFGTLFFAPGFSEYDHYLINAVPGYSSVTVLDPFTWPENAGAADHIIWYAAMTDPEVTELLGDYDAWEFGWASPAP